MPPRRKTDLTGKAKPSTKKLPNSSSKPVTTTNFSDDFTNPTNEGRSSSLRSTKKTTRPICTDGSEKESFLIADGRVKISSKPTVTAQRSAKSCKSVVEELGEPESATSGLAGCFEDTPYIVEVQDGKAGSDHSSFPTPRPSHPERKARSLQTFDQSKMAYITNYVNQETLRLTFKYRPIFCDGTHTDTSADYTREASFNNIPLLMRKASLLHDETFCEVCSFEQWPSSKFCWNERCPISPVYYKLTGAKPLDERRPNTVAAADTAEGFSVTAALPNPTLYRQQFMLSENAGGTAPILSNGSKRKRKTKLEMLQVRELKDTQRPQVQAGCSPVDAAGVSGSNIAMTDDSDNIIKRTRCSPRSHPDKTVGGVTVDSLEGPAYQTKEVHSNVRNGTATNECVRENSFAVLKVEGKDIIGENNIPCTSDVACLPASKCDGSLHSSLASVTDKNINLAHNYSIPCIDTNAADYCGNICSFGSSPSDFGGSSTPSDAGSSVAVDTTFSVRNCSELPIRI